MVNESIVGAGVVDGVVGRTVILASSDTGLRQRLRASLAGLRWQVREAGGGAEAIAQMEASQPEAIFVDSWLPDLEVSEFAGQIRLMYPGTELLRIDGVIDGAARSPRRNELLHALREAEDRAVTDTAAWAAAPVGVPKASARIFAETQSFGRDGLRDLTQQIVPALREREEPVRELARLIRLVAPRSTTVLIEGETGTGKEVVARAVHRLSERAGKAFVVLNCAAIPETLLEAELFGHTRGAFTGAVQSRTGRIEAAHGGTLFLDEIGEMPLALQAKMLRFLECGELQRVGDNETMRVDVRVVAATHQPLEQRAAEGAFRLDLYHRLAVFPVEVPTLRTRMEDLGLLAEHFLEQMGQEMPRKRLTIEAEARLHEHHWPGNVRELMHALERGAILSGDRMEIGADEIRFRRASRG
ncbi:MAG TPA: sigma-54 dependent transcriptional regulator [Edaphobacter sp.]